MKFPRMVVTRWIVSLQPGFRNLKAFSEDVYYLTINIQVRIAISKIIAAQKYQRLKILSSLVCAGFVVLSVSEIFRNGLLLELLTFESAGV